MVCLRLKNIFGERWKQSYRDVKISAKPTQSCGLAANGQFLAFPWDVGGGGMVAVTPLDVVGRDTKSIKLKGHTSGIMDMIFNEFVPNVLATASDGW
ncbi:bifunctional Domain of unknown function DUF1899/WD40-YVTN repeat-like-containing domain superfamily/Coronin [Babesia duncani]|uniref:DUF1899 domain-containing protein n=1 Tax=Babesia duncani TaxID=323732 RepID=A0AAD9UP54_9APIC|nr:bifunctional Domain of unknown function DUF1899/WD40-YVTN repeat-like-containing domain superfamily/Coronin [Babesia duncani]